MKVREVMSSEVDIASPSQTIREVAGIMAQDDIGALPVGANDRLIGMITDRDIALRGIGAGKGPQTSVRDVMTTEVKYCFDDEDISNVAKNMSDEQVRRLPVLNRDMRLVGILSLCDIAATHGDDIAGSTLKGISQPGGKHSHAQ
jgi:CBS domain-containing protein